ncbi:YafY family protein [Alicyclobacillus sp. SO9]|uniref:helix-turn-helix transcriptional regulator n=1 Tax=Alicyclobacillus sp. SO9 TaxID=2665646 RepID=UPI0018E7D187|nr:YafY family protein [Alicyclobacillus sp. SO9]QQE80062.1 YafY family transcriptional regulator [Alicyclobacillus sp. SO9]
MAKADGMLAIVWMLKSRGRMTAQNLADALEVSVRSVYRYIDSLCASGVPIEAEAGHDGGFHLAPSFNDAPLFFRPEEKIALKHSALFARTAGYPFTKDLEQALHKIELYSTPQQLEDLSQHTRGLAVVNSIDHSAYADTLSKLTLGITACRTVSITYRKIKAQSDTHRNIDPYGMIHWRDRWYLIAFCHLRTEIRIFRVDRIQKYALSSNRFVRPDGFSITDFFAEQQLQIQTSEQLVRMVLTGETDAIADLSRHWFLKPRMVSRWSKKAVFVVEEQSLHAYIPHILLAFGKSIFIAEPASLRHRIANLAQQLADYYQQSTDRTCQ